MEGVEVKIEYEEIDLLSFINNRGDFGSNTCSDYVDSIENTERGWVVTCFVEPCGNISKEASTLKEALLWWKDVFATQPKDWDYVRAGWHLWELGYKGLPNDVKKVWKLETDIVRKES